MDNIYKQLYEKGYLNKKQYDFLELIQKNKIVSLYYELRILLYVGILLFTGGVGYFAYQNIGEIGHLITMILIGVAIGIGFYFIKKFSKQYSNLKVVIQQPYFDYVLILVASLIIALFTYIQVYFNLVEILINWSTFISSGILLFMCYRYDNRALLSMGITALSAAVGITISPVDWAKGLWVYSNNLYITSIFLGAFLTLVGQISYRKGIKKHFKFTYQNFGLILYFAGVTYAIFSSTNNLFYSSLLLISSGALLFYTWKKREFLFFLYSSISGYIAITYLLFSLIDYSDGAYIIMTYYFPFSCISYIIFLLSNKSHFTNV